jgi:hypothetical protein
MLDDKSTEQWAEHRTEAYDTKHDTQVLSSFSEWHQIANNDFNKHVDSTSANPLDYSSGNQHSHVISTTAETAA